MKPPNTRIALSAVDATPNGASVMQLSGGAFVGGKDPDTDYICDRCGAVILRVPGGIQFRGESGPVVLICFACGTKNLAP